MKLRSLYLYAAVASLILAAAVPLLNLHEDVSSSQAVGEWPVLSVRRTVALEQQWPQTIGAVGSIAAWQEAVIGAEIGAQRLSRLLVDVGDRVQRGQLLAQLSPGTLAAELDLSRATLREAEVNAAEASRAAERARALRTSGVLSQQALDQSIAASDAAQARLAAARARVEADALRLAYIEVRAPDDGVISARAAVEGSLIQAGAEILRLQRQGRLEWRAELPGPELVRVAPGQSVFVAIAGLQPIEGKVRAISPQVDPDSRAGIVYVDLPPAAEARAGLFARGEFMLDQQTVLTLPETAVLSRDGFSYIFRFEGDRVRMQKVTLGSRRGDRLEIRAGLEADTAVVDSGVGFLADGMRVHVLADGPDVSLAAH